jgi:glucosamine kinase
VGGARYFIGLDGGATRCRARLLDSDGRQLAEQAGPATNIYIDFAQSLSGINDLVTLLLRTAGLPFESKKQTAFGLGLAGLSGAEDGARVEAALIGWARVEAVNDAVTACVGANGADDGGLVIAGTGTAGIARMNGQSKIVGGRGFWLGDDGSGARIGADALRAALRAHDGLEDMTGLSQGLLEHFGFDPHAMTRWALDAKPGDYGAFAPQVFAAARSGEPRAREIAERAARAIATLARRVLELGAPQVAYVGGVAEPLREFMPEGMSALLQPPKYDAIDGAILMIGGAVAARGAAL